MSLPSFVKVQGGWPVLDVGSIVHPIEILKQGPSSPPAYDAGGVVSRLSPFLSAYAAIETDRGGDLVRSGQTGTQLHLKVGMWWQDGILPSMVVKRTDGTQYVIEDVENVRERNIVLVLNCLAIGNNT
jgi:hypothetical protein